MKILIISYYYPPFNCIGGIRVSKTSKYLKLFGHDVKVLTCSQQLLPEDLKIEIPSSDIIYTSWININKPIQVAIGGEKRIASQGYSVGKGLKGRIMKWGGNVYMVCMNFPDNQIGWVPFAYRAGQRLIGEWRPDLIFASGLPISSLMVARLLSSNNRIPWVGELRDLWVDNSYRFMPNWRTILEVKLEKYIFSNVKGLVTVSEPLAEVLTGKYNCPVTAITNGFDEDDFVGTKRQEIDKNYLSLAYTGMVYEGRQDPTSLFRAIQILRDDYDVHIKLYFYGRYLQLIRDLSVRFNLEWNVEVNDPITYEESLKIQRGADVLLLFLGYGEGERGVYTGKFFEYLRSRRPILAVGGSDNVASKVIFQRGAGFVLDDPARIITQLLKWYSEKKTTGKVADNDESVYVGFSRKEKIRELDCFLSDSLGTGN